MNVLEIKGLMPDGYTQKMIWDLAVELAFECHQASLFFPKPEQNHVGFRLRESSGAVVGHIKCGLDTLDDHGPWFQSAGWFMKDVAHQLDAAACLGFLDQVEVLNLGSMMNAMRRLMG